MPNSISATGLTTATQAELLEQYTAAMQVIYGNDIDLSSSSPDGQLINLFIQSVLDLQDLLTQIYNMFDPDNAIGVILDQRVAINGVLRKGGTYTVQPVTIYTTQLIPNLWGTDQSTNQPFTVADGAGNQYQLQVSQTNFNPGSGGQSLTFVASDPGAVQSSIGAITVPVTIVLGVGGGPASSGIYNPSTYSTLGINEESDAVLKVRRQQSVSLSSQGYLSGLEAALNNINGIGAIQVYENDSDTADVDTGVPGHSIWAIVANRPPYPASSVNAYSSTTTYAVGDLALSGGVVYASGRNNNVGNSVTDPSWWWEFDQVAWAIYLKRNAGCGMFGSIEVAVTQLDGTQFVVSFDTVVQEPIFIAFYATALANNTVPNYSAILAGLPKNFTPGVNQEVNITALGTAVQAIDPNTLVTFSGSGTPASGGFSATVGGTYAPTLTPSAANKQFEVTAGNIIMLPMILTPQSVSVTHGFNQQFTPLGGHGAASSHPYSTSIFNSGGSITDAGLYTAGSTTAVQDTIIYIDALGNTCQAQVMVT